MNGEILGKGIGELQEVQFYTEHLDNQYWKSQWVEKSNGQIQLITEYFMNRRIPNGTYGGVRGRGLVTPSYSINIFLPVKERNSVSLQKHERNGLRVRAV